MFDLKKFILEEARNRLFLIESVSDISGKLHENLVHKFLSGNNHPDEESRKEHDDLKSKVSEQEYNDALVRANHAAEHIRRHIIGNAKVARIERTSKPGQTGESQSDNPSDLVIHYKDGSKHGISLKTAREYGAKVPVSNPGLGTLERYTGVQSSNDYQKAMKKLHAKHPHTKGMSVSQLNNEIKTNPKVKDTASSIGTSFLKDSLKKHSDALNSMDSKKKADFIRREVLRNSKTSFPVFKVETSGRANKVTTSHSDQSSHDHILNDHENISHRVVGNSIVFSHRDHGDFASMRFKYASRFGSSVKGSGELRGKKIVSQTS